MAICHISSDDGDDFFSGIAAYASENDGKLAGKNTRGLTPCSESTKPVGWMVISSSTQDSNTHK